MAGLGAAGAVVFALGAQLPTQWNEQVQIAAAAVNGSSASGEEAMAEAPRAERELPSAADSVEPTATPTDTPPPLVAPAPTETAVPPVAVNNGDRSSNKVALTFDADLSQYTLNRINSGAFPQQYNEPVIDYLQSTGTPATIFVTGLWAQQYPMAMQRFAGSELFEVANHTWSHEAWTTDCYGLPFIADEQSKRAQVQATDEIIASYTGFAPKYFRFPGLCHSPEDVALVASMGSVTVDTDISGSDAFANNGQAAAAAIAAQVQPGSIILLHLNGAPNAPATAQIVAQLVPMLAERGLEPVTLTELLGP